MENSGDKFKYKGITDEWSKIDDEWSTCKLTNHRSYKTFTMHKDDKHRLDEGYYEVVYTKHKPIGKNGKNGRTINRIVDIVKYDPNFDDYMELFYDDSDPG